MEKLICVRGIDLNANGGPPCAVHKFDETGGMFYEAVDLFSHDSAA